MSEIAQSADFSSIRYAQGWEDPRCLEAAFGKLDSAHVLSIAAAGDNTLALLASGDRGPARIESVDMNPAQCALLELKAAAIRSLDYDALLAFLGVEQATGTRSSLYAIVRSELSHESRRFWDTRIHLITQGVIHQGRLEAFFRTFRTLIVPVTNTTTAVSELLDQFREPAERAIFWDERFANRRWKWLLRAFGSPAITGRFGRDPSFFRHVDMQDVGSHYVERVRHACAVLDPTTNPYLHYIFRGTYVRDRAIPDYLTIAAVTKLRERLDRLTIVCSELEHHLHQMDARGIDACNLSDIFEWMSPQLAEQVLRAACRAARPGARIAYWNHLVHRARPESMASLLLPHREIAAQIHGQDRSIFYRSFQVEEVLQ